MALPLAQALERAKQRAKEVAPKSAANPFLIYQTDPVRYAEERLGFFPWAGVNGPGQREIFEDIGESVRAQLAGEPATKVFRVEAGHGVGKTIGAGALVNWFFDCFPPSIAMTTAPTSEQVKLLLWKDIKRLREGKGLPGRVLPDDPRMIRSPDWFAFGRTTSDAGGKGSERFQGQHHPHLLFVLDEAEGVPEFVFDAIEAMMTGGTVILVLMLANPKTRTSRFHRKGKEAGVKNYRLSCLTHPNVVYGDDRVKGATSREWVIERIAKWCEPVSEHDPDSYTFEVGFDVFYDGELYGKAGQVWKPNAEFCFRVLGVAPANLADNVFISSGRYEAALTNEPLEGQGDQVRIGVDCARFGSDKGSVYRRHAGRVRKWAEISQGDTSAYVERIKEAAIDAHDDGATDLQVRVDGTGGFGSGVVDSLKADMELREMFETFTVVEIQFGATAEDPSKYDNIVTQLYAEAGETIRGLRIERVPKELEADLTERTYEFVNRGGRSLKRLTEKEKFRKVHKRSPDDGDGFVLAIAPDHVVESFIRETFAPVAVSTASTMFNYIPR